MYVSQIVFSRLKAQIPDIKTSLDIVKHLQSRKVSFIVHVLVPLMLDDYMYFHFTCITMMGEVSDLVLN